MAAKLPPPPPSPKDELTAAEIRLKCLEFATKHGITGGPERAVEVAKIFETYVKS